jgi:hypothetical protein
VFGLTHYVCILSDSSTVDPYKWQDMLEDAITHSVHAVHQPSRAGHAASHHISPPLPALAHRHSSSSIPHSGDLIGISACAKDEVRPDTTVEREPSQTSLQTDFQLRTISSRHTRTNEIPMRSKHPIMLAEHKQAAAKVKDIRARSSCITTTLPQRRIHLPCDV